jgi:hypothetical protein
VRTVRRGALAAAFVLGIAASGGAQQAPDAPPSAGYSWDDPTLLRFLRHDRPVKAVLLAGSIGAFGDHPYPRLWNQWCEGVELQNLSHMGFGAPRLLQRFRRHVVGNPRIPMRNPAVEMWLVWAGGINSLGNRHRTVWAMRNAFVEAHRRGMRVLALSLTPWGSDETWSLGHGLEMMEATQHIVDFTMGRSDPSTALGRYAAERHEGPTAPFTAEERADVAIDLYDSRLRDRDARLLDRPSTRVALRRDPRWQRRVSALERPIRRERLDADTDTLVAAPRWYLRPEYRGFDSVHPNRQGHRAIAEIACPQLPASWRCRCPR